MGRERVKSKNLFNFRPQGFLDKDIEEFYEKGKVTLLCSYFLSPRKYPETAISQSCTGRAHQRQRGLLVGQDEEHVGDRLCGDDEAVDGQEHCNLFDGC